VPFAPSWLSLNLGTALILLPFYCESPPAESVPLKCLWLCTRMSGRIIRGCYESQKGNSSGAQLYLTNERIPIFCDICLTAVVHPAFPWKTGGNRFAADSSDYISHNEQLLEANLSIVADEYRASVWGVPQLTLLPTHYFPLSFKSTIYYLNYLSRKWPFHICQRHPKVMDHIPIPGWV